MSSKAIVGRCIGCLHNFRQGNCGGCGAVPGPDETQCDGEDTDDCALCGSGDWALMCDDCRFYAAQDAEPTALDEETR